MCMCQHLYVSFTVQINTVYKNNPEDNHEQKIQNTATEWELCYCYWQQRRKKEDNYNSQLNLLEWGAFSGFPAQQMQHYTASQ